MTHTNDDQTQALMEAFESQLCAFEGGPLNERLPWDLLGGDSAARPSAETPADMVGRNHGTLAAIDEDLRAALTYPLAAGGKRIRPRLCLMVAQAIGGSAAKENALKAARALELVHTYSLVHDDLPCMDDDDLRRGRPTTHKVYGEAKALLVGDALLTEAFLSVARIQTLHQPHIASMGVQILALAAGHRGMIAGQWLDVTMEQAPHSPPSIKPDKAILEAIHTLKTGCLIGASIELGALCGLNEREMSHQSTAQLRELARTAGLELGLAFQIMDDILDTTATSATLGKTAGKDAQQSKTTAVALLGLAQARVEATRITASARSKLQQLLERLPAPDDGAEAIREHLFDLVDALATRGA
jgi:geranylgeranyl pyrophosphate synthase